MNMRGIYSTVTDLRGSLSCNRLLSGLSCPGGCVAGAGTLQAVEKSTALINKYVKDAEKQNSLDSDYQDNLDLLTKED